MVYLSRIYTKTGDRGDTALGDGTRVPKDHPRVTAYGSVDELNAVLGLLAVQLPEGDDKTLVRGIQNDLFDVGADLCVPPSTDEAAGARLRIQPGQALRLERAIDGYTARLEPLRSFILPGGRLPAAWCHLARTVCRRAERDVVALMAVEALNAQVLIYLNRLSDLLFQMARVLNEDGKEDVLWIPGKTVASGQ